MTIKPFAEPDCTRRAIATYLDIPALVHHAVPGSSMSATISPVYTRGRAPWPAGLPPSASRLLDELGRVVSTPTTTAIVATPRHHRDEADRRSRMLVAGLPPRDYRAGQTGRYALHLVAPSAAHGPRRCRRSPARPIGASWSLQGCARRDEAKTVRVCPHGAVSPQLGEAGGVAGTTVTACRSRVRSDAGPGGTMLHVDGAYGTEVITA